MTTPSTVTSNELNFLVFRYLQESGFTHAAFALGYEAGINKTTIDGNLIPPGALVTFVQKGLQYVELEANLESDKLEGDDDFSFLQPYDLITKDVSELQRIMKEKRQNLQKEREAEKERREKDKEKQERERDKAEKVKEQEREKDREKQQKEQKENFAEDLDDIKAKGKSEENGVCGGPEPMDITPTPQFVASEIHSSEVTILEGHGSEVFACAWSPTSSLLASGSGDSTARIWAIPDGPCGSNMLPPQVHILKHFKGRTNEKSKDVTTLDWNGEGTLLATGSYDGQARIWSKDGELKNTLAKHKGPIFSLKWNKKGDFLLSGSVDKTAIVWDTRTWECRQQFEFHSAPALDVDWRNNVSFATCSTDNMIYVCKVGEGRPVRAYAGHQGEVNAIKWDPTGSLLASCSDDGTAKIWSLKNDKCLYDFRDHVKEIYTIRWSPTSSGTNNPNLPLILASASFDSTIKLWEVDRGSLLHNLNGHRQPVYSVAFSPNGQFLASGSLDQSLHLWSVKEGKLIKTYSGGGGIFEVCWNKEGNKIAACFSNNTVCVIDFRM